MGLLQQIGSLIGGQDQVHNYAAGQGNFADPSSPDTQNFRNMVQNAPQGALPQVFGAAARQMNPAEYAEHITPGAGGTNPLGGIGQSGLGTIASALLGKLTGQGGYSPASLLNRIPGMRTADPNQMDPDQVANLARYTQQNHPELFGQAAAQVAQQQPDLLHSFLGKAGLALGAAALASHFIKLDRQ